MFRGQHHHVLDAKGRVSIPATYRDELQPAPEQAPFLTAHQDCLRLYSREAWIPYEATLLEEAAIDPDAQDLARLIVASVEEAPIDKQGRILVPQYLREHAGLDKEVVFAGVGSTVELWDTARFRRTLGRTQSNFRSISERLAGRVGSGPKS